MAAKKTTPNLVSGFLERISSDVFSNYPRELTDLVGASHGVYALYTGDLLYYVGLAKDLRRRIKDHLMDRHKGRWDRFSLYLVRRESHIAEMESLILRIADPRGNAHSGSLPHAHNLKADLHGSIQRAQKRQREELLGGRKRAAPGKRRAKAKARPHKATPADTAKGRPPALAQYVPYQGRQWLMLRASYKGKDFVAWVRGSGAVKFDGRMFNSPSSAARAAIGRNMNGWTFWRFKNADSEWVLLDTLRKQSQAT